MPSHFSTVGFQIDSEEDIPILADKIYDTCAMYDSEAGSYHQWTSVSGAELWMQLLPEGDLIGLNPHFHGEGQMTVKLTSFIPSKTPSPLDGSYHGWADPESSESEAEGLYPFIFDCPNAILGQPDSYPVVRTLQIAAFAEEIRIYADEQTYNAADDVDGFNMASESFIPVGLFGHNVGSSAIACFTGRVLKADVKINELTALSYHWALVQTLGGTFDVVIDPELIETELKPGNFVQGYFWLSGQLQPVCNPLTPETA